jgi:hypothetical protein
LSEVRGSGKGEIVSGNYTLFRSAVVKAQQGVAVMLKNYIEERLTKVEYYSDRWIFVGISIKPFDIVIVQVYMPRMDHDDDEIE